MKYISNKLMLGVWFVMLVLSVLMFGAGVAGAGDPNGAETFTDDVAGLTLSINVVWTLVAAFLVFSMQSGFALLGGLLQKKNMLSYMAHCFVDATLGAIMFFLIGFAIMFGGSGAFPGLERGWSGIGWDGFMLMGGSYDVQTVMFWLFQMVFATKTVSIIAGAVAERMKFTPYIIYSCLMCGIIYPLYGHWVWGGGWLGNLPIGSGVVDFAGCAVVHMVGGIMALMGAWALGPRVGKYNPDGSPNAIPGHNMAFVVIGTLILAFGWFGFNAGSTVAGTDLRIGIIAANTFIAAAAGASMMLFFTWKRQGVVDIGFVCNGALAGLVAITAPCAYVAPWAAGLIGLLAGLIMRGAVALVESKFKIDDPLGAVAVHAANGMWGMIAIGFFADGTYAGVSGLITGNAAQLLAQFIGTIVALAYAMAWGGAVFFGLRGTIGIRVSEKEEFDGVDVHQHGTHCYPVEEGLFGAVGESMIDLEQEREVESILEQAMQKDARREKIYSDKLGKWVYATSK
ncbi:MAG: ammonium transporter [Candidatus Brocadiaceae bacterium]|nr:ammonium transporter [Candidatus Brocadiaceae bacterium]